jgi:hypothetical protein
MLSTFSSERDISGQETCHILLGCPLVKSSRKIRNLCVSPNVSELVNFQDSSTARTGLIEKYKSQPVTSMKDVTLLEFATHWDYARNKYTKRGRQGAKPYAVNIWPRFKPDPDDEDQYEDYCYAKTILHHPF